MATTNPLDIPEILAQVGSYIRLWDQRKDGVYNFNPQDMLTCLLVSHHFRNTLLPIFWYTFDEKAMSHIPVDLVSKYTPHFRAYYNYGHRSDIPDNQRGLSTGLTCLTIGNMHGDRLSLQHIELINSNPRLKYLEIKDWIESDSSYEGMFSHLNQLEYLEYSVQGPSDASLHKRLFRPISATLKVLHLGSINGRLDLEGVLFPNLKELYGNLNDLQDAEDLLKGCPNLETIGQFFVIRMQPNVIVEALSTGLCPNLKAILISGTFNQEEAPEKTIECRTGLEKLSVYLTSTSERLTRAISHHTSLTYLSIHVGRLNLSAVLLVLNSCGGLKRVSLQNVEYGDMKKLLYKDHWKNPGILEGLRMGNSSPMRFRRFLGRNRDPLPRVRVCSAETTGGTQPVHLIGRRAPLPFLLSDLQQRVQIPEFSKMLLDAVMDGFVRLEQIEVDGVVYRRDQATLHE